MTAAKKARNWRIYWARCAGRRLHLLAAEHGVSKETVRQVVLRCTARRRRDRVRQERLWLEVQGLGALYDRLHRDRSQLLRGAQRWERAS